MEYSSNNMDICEDGHDRIVHAERHCPLCEMKKEFDEAETKITELRADIEKAEEDYSELETKYEKIKDTKTWLVGEETT